MTTPICRCHGCRFEKPALEAQVRDLTEELRQRHEQIVTLNVNGRAMWNALDYIRGRDVDMKAKEVAEDALASLLTLGEVAA